MTRRRLRLLIVPAAAVLAALPSSAQVRMGSGHALDSNLELGTWGYNRAGRGAIGQESTFRLYTPTYSVSRPQDIRADRHDSFLNERRYGMDRPLGYYEQRWRPRRPESAPAAGWGARLEAPVPAVPPPEVGPPPPLSSEASEQLNEISYGIGFYLGQEIREGLALDGVDVNVPDVVAGFGEGLYDLAPSVPTDEYEAALADLDRRLEARRVQRLLAENPQFRQQYEDNEARGRRFRDAFGQEAGVVALPDGIEYKILTAGQGASPAPTDLVVLNLRVSRVDGTEIYTKEGIENRVDRMIKAAASVLPRMKVGGRWLTVIPPDLAYGDAGRPPEIGPNETLVIEVELVAIEK